MKYLLSIILLTCVGCCPLINLKMSDTVHIVQEESETFKTISLKYYGDVLKDDLIRDSNCLNDKTPLKIGQRIKIPVLSF